MALPRIDIEHEMRAVVRVLGGRVLDDALPKVRLHKNADFIFDSEKIVIELKCLTEDNLRSEANEAKALSLWRKLYASGQVRSEFLNAEDWDNLPRPILNQLCKAQMGDPIEKRIREANRQIRETKKALGLQDYQGLLLIANDGITSVVPAALINAMALVLRNKHYSDIRHFILFTANMYAVNIAEGTASFLWIKFDMQDGKPIDAVFHDSFSEAWKRHHMKLIGLPNIASDPSGLDSVLKTQFVRANRPSE